MCQSLKSKIYIEHRYFCSELLSLKNNEWIDPEINTSLCKKRSSWILPSSRHWAALHVSMFPASHLTEVLWTNPFKFFFPTESLYSFRSCSLELDKSLMWGAWGPMVPGSHLKQLYFNRVSRKKKMSQIILCLVVRHRKQEDIVMQESLQNPWAHSFMHLFT